MISNESTAYDEFVGRESIIEAVKARPGELHLVVEPETVRIISVEVLSIGELGKRGLAGLMAGTRRMVWVAQYECLGTIVGIAPTPEGPKSPEHPVPLKVCKIFDAHTGQVVAVSGHPPGVEIVS